MPEQLTLPGCRVQYTAYFYSKKRERLVRYCSESLPHTLTIEELTVFISNACASVIDSCNEKFSTKDFALMTDEEVECVLDDRKIEDYGHA